MRAADAPARRALCRARSAPGRPAGYARVRRKYLRPMQTKNRSKAFWFITAFLFLSVFLMLLGQTMAVFNYDLAVSLGLQESIDQVGPSGVQVNRAFGIGDTVVYIPLMIVSLVGLFLRKRWALLTTAAVSGVSAYWTVTVASIMLLAPGTPGYNYTPGTEIILFVAAYLAFGAWSLIYISIRGEDLISQATGSDRAL